MNPIQGTYIVLLYHEKEPITQKILSILKYSKYTVVLLGNKDQTLLENSIDLRTEFSTEFITERNRVITRDAYLVINPLELTENMLYDIHDRVRGSEARTASIRYYGQWNPPVDRILYEHYFSNRYNGTCIECGAFDGLISASTKVFEDLLGWRTINIEPVPLLYDKLVINRPNSLNLNIALSDSSGTSIFHHAVHPELGLHFGNGSIKHTPEHMKELKKERCEFVDYTVHTTTYKEMIKKYNITTVDLFVLDVEGHELEVIRGMKNCDVLPLVFCIEFPHIGIDNITSGLQELCDSDKNPYKLDFIADNNAYYSRI